MDNEADLVGALQAGDRDATDQVVRVHHGFLLAMVRPLVGEDPSANV